VQKAERLGETLKKPPGPYRRIFFTVYFRGSTGETKALLKLGACKALALSAPSSPTVTSAVPSEFHRGVAVQVEFERKRLETRISSHHAFKGRNQALSSSYG
jgi:hypothetical protein